MCATGGDGDEVGALLASAVASPRGWVFREDVTGWSGVGHPPEFEGLDMGEFSGGMDSCLRRNDGKGGFLGVGGGWGVRLGSLRGIRVEWGEGRLRFLAGHRNDMANGGWVRQRWRVGGAWASPLRSTLRRGSG